MEQVDQLTLERGGEASKERVRHRISVLDDLQGRQMSVEGENEGQSLTAVASTTEERSEPHHRGKGIAREEGHIG